MLIGLTYKITPESDEEDENNSDIFTDFSWGLQEHIEKVEEQLLEIIEDYKNSLKNYAKKLW